MAKIDHTQPKDQFELIEAWLANELSEEAAKAVEIRRAADPAFSTAVEQHRLAHRLLSHSAGIGVKARLQAFKQEREKTSLPTFSRLWYAIAASLILFALCSSWWWARQSYSTPALIAAYGTPYSAGPLRGVSQAGQPLQLAMNAYVEGDYTRARELFFSAGETLDHNAESSFYLGNTLFQLEEYSAAIPYFQFVMDTQDMRYRAAAEWYFLLCLLANKQTEAFEQMADTLFQTQDHPYQQQLLALQEELNSFARQLPGIN